MSLAATYLQDIRAQYPNPLDRDERRITQLGLMQVVKEMTDSPTSIIDEDVKMKARESSGRTLSIPVMQKGSVTVGNARSCTITGGRSTSALYNVVWKTASANIVMNPDEYEKNEVKYLSDLNKKIMEMVEAFGIVIETDIEASLDTAKTQVYGSSLVTDTYSLAGNAIQVLPDQTELFFNDLEPINFSDDFYSSSVKVIGNANLMSYVNHYINQGGGNNTNLNYQFAGKDFRYSNRVDNGVGVRTTGYFMPDGSVGFLTRLDRSAKNNRKTTEGTEFFPTRLNGLPFEVGVQYKSSCADISGEETSGLEEMTATVKEKWQFSFDYAIITPYNSDPATKAGAIRKFEFIPAP